jgi:hypothetical protein
MTGLIAFAKVLRDKNGAPTVRVYKDANALRVERRISISD